MPLILGRSGTKYVAMVTSLIYSFRPGLKAQLLDRVVQCPIELTQEKVEC